MNERQARRCLDGDLELIHGRGEKWVFALRDRPRVVSVRRFADWASLAAFRGRRQALREAAGHCPGLCLPEYVKERETPGGPVLIETMARASGAGPEGTRPEALLSILEALHGAGWTHMDVKPEHLLYIEGRWRLIDFDSAMPLGAVYQRRDVTLEYAPPEALRHDLADGMDDLYAAALMLYETLNGGRLPFQRHGQRLAAWRRAHARRVPPPALCTPAQAEFFKRALARRREDRYPTASALRQAWERVGWKESE